MHPGMRFYRYHYFLHKDYNFEWYDEDMTQRAKDLINAYIVENLQIRRKIEELCGGRGYVIQNEESV